MRRGELFLAEALGVDIADQQGHDDARVDLPHAPALADGREDRLAVHATRDRCLRAAHDRGVLLRDLGAPGQLLELREHEARQRQAARLGGGTQRIVDVVGERLESGSRAVFRE